jgi:hypothetical protein
MGCRAKFDAVSCIWAELCCHTRAVVNADHDAFSAAESRRRFDHIEVGMSAFTVLRQVLDIEQRIDSMSWAVSRNLANVNAGYFVMVGVHAAERMSTLRKAHDGH